jgi:hypothetical protein
MHAIPIPDSALQDTTLLDTFEEVLTTGARQNIIRDGELAPVAGLIGNNVHPGSDGGYCCYVALISHFMEDERGKDMLASVMPMLADRFSAFAVAIVTEAWAVDYEGEGLTLEDAQRDRAKYKSLGEHPNAVEVVNIAIETRQRSMVRSYPIERDADGNVTGLGADLNADKGEAGELQGRFANLLNPVPGGVN